jgi:hypothetical protein
MADSLGEEGIPYVLTPLSVLSDKAPLPESRQLYNPLGWI